MKEALFRGQRICQKLADKGEWVYGAFIPDPREALEGRVRGVGFIWQWEPEIGRKKMFTVSRKTVGPWTGKTDVNGVRIFEDDLITCTTWVWETNDFRESKPALVVWNAAHAAFEYAWPEWPDIPPGTLDDEIKWEVVGNVHDNPELLGAEI